VAMDVAIVSPEEKVWEGEADLVIARSPEGEFGIMRGHIPFLAALVPGLVTVVSGNDRDEYFVPGGFLEASGLSDETAPPREEGGVRYHVIVLADSAERADDIDVEEAKRRAEDARKKRDEETEERVEAELRVELARVEVAQSRGG
jgi:F-type H+-transporting ATPase subunit epsilon